MPVLTIRDVDETVKAALEERARKEGRSQAEVARRALADGLGVKVKKRDLRGLSERIFGAEVARELAEIDWTKPAYSDEELDQFIEDGDERAAEGWDKPAPCRDT